MTYPFDMHRLTKESEELEKKLNPTRSNRRKRQYEDEEHEEEEEEEHNPYQHIGYHQEGYGDHQETHGYHQEYYGYRQENYRYHQENREYHQENREYHEENRGYHQEGHSEGEDEGYHEGYQEGYQEGYHEGNQETDTNEGYRGEEYGQPESTEEEIRVVEDQSLFRWLAISYASTHRTMTHTFRGGCHTEDPTRGMGIVNRAKWKPIPGSKY